MFFSASKEIHLASSTYGEKRAASRSQLQHQSDVFGFDECFALLNLHSRPAIASGLLLLRQRENLLRG